MHPECSEQQHCIGLFSGNKSAVPTVLLTDGLCSNTRVIYWPDQSSFSFPRYPLSPEDAPPVPAAPVTLEQVLALAARSEAIAIAQRGVERR